MSKNKLLIGISAAILPSSSSYGADQDAFEVSNSHASYRQCGMNIGNAFLADIHSDDGIIKSVSVVRGQLLYKGKTYGPGKYRGNSSGALEQCE